MSYFEKDVGHSRIMSIEYGALTDAAGFAGGAGRAGSIRNARLTKTIILFFAV